MKLAIIGSHKSPEIDIISQLKMLPTVLLSGGTSGIDNCVREFAEDYKIPLIEYLPDFEKHGEQAILERNKLLIEMADYVLFFWDGASIKTKAAIDYAKEIGKLIKIVPIRITVPVGYRAVVKHRFPNNTLALDMCKQLEEATLKYSKISWIENRFWYSKEDTFDVREISLDIIPLVHDSEKICKEIMALFSQKYCYIEFYLTSEHIKAIAPKINEKVIYKEVECNQSLYDLTPFKENSLRICNYPIFGGIVVRNAPQTFEQIKLDLQNIGFFNIRQHTIQKKQYKIDFETYTIDSNTLINAGWINGTYMNANIHIEFPNEWNIDRTKEWYDLETDWKIFKSSSQNLYDYSGDDLSIEPSLW